MAKDAETAKDNLRKVMNEEKVKGFSTVLVSKNINDGVVHT